MDILVRLVINSGCANAIVEIVTNESAWCFVLNSVSVGSFISRAISVSLR